MTNADRIRHENDLHMAVTMAGTIVSFLCQGKLISGTEADHKGMISDIADDMLEWLTTEEGVKTDESNRIKPEN